MKKIYLDNLIFCIILVLSVQLNAQNTETIFLSGTGADETVNWEFYCTEGMNSGKWTSIPVPSNWELQGFGKYNYGNDKDSVRGKEQGLYKYEFDVPADWKKKQVNIVFEGSMTDTEVKINGRSAGPIHQGAFYRFQYEISELVKYGKTNLLEVTVSKHSANESVNKAERFADYWVFGGIFRPVYLEAKPQQNIERIAIDAKADGTFTADVFLNNSNDANKIVAQVLTLQNEKIGEPFMTKISKNAQKVRLKSKLKNIKNWNPEDPNLYRVEFKLLANEKVIHKTSSRFGFRTVEVRERDGIYVNGVKVKFKGVNRHTFRPEHGRTSCKKMSIEDVELIKSMNMNAVRMSHYPPDSHFLDVCDSLGLFVLDELTGWHNAYDTQVGSKLVKEMVVRDVNYPSVVLWDNGNEGGHNFELDSLFTFFDIQKRTVLHPWQEHNGIVTTHYRSYDYGVGTYWHGHAITLPTEFLHGMYDGGHGAGLYDYWELMWKTPRAAGGFLWDLADEGVIRTDKNNVIDTDGSHAPDGIVGPHHEKEGSYFAIKEIWSPVQPEAIDLTAAFNGNLNVENRYLYTNLKECTFDWKLAKMPLPNDNSEQKVLSGSADSPDIAPGHKGILQLNLPNNWFLYDVLYLTATDKYKMELYTWSYAISLPENVVAKLMLNKQQQKGVTVAETDSMFVVNAGTVKYSIGKNDGLLKKVVNSKGSIPFDNGPNLCAGEVYFKSIQMKKEVDTLHLIVSFDEKKSRMKEFIWTFYPSGWAKLKVFYVPEKYDIDFDFMGVSFSYPEDLVSCVRWLGHGPYRIWKNRTQGVELAIHQKDYNNTITGVAPLVYPEFKGYHSNLYWAKIESKEQSFTVATSAEDVFLQLYTPGQPEKIFERTAPVFPSGDISFLQAIPPIGTKSNDPWNMGPSGKKNMFFDFGPYDNWRERCKIMTLFFDFSENK